MDPPRLSASPFVQGLVGFVVILALVAVPMVFAPPGSEAPTIRVAAADAPEEARAGADLVCDGVDDRVEIHRAFAALPRDGGRIRLTAGTFTCPGNLVPAPCTILEREGTIETTVAISGYYHSIKIDRPYTTICSLRITDRACVRITASHVRVEDVLAEETLRGYYPGMPGDMGGNGAFFFWAENRVIEDFVFYRCVAREIGTHGFNMNGRGEPRLIRNVRFVECSAVRCGDDRGHPWATGFDFHEGNDLVDLAVERCYAAGNWESGFHLETGGRQEGIRLVDCIPEGNGWRNTNPGDPTAEPPVRAAFYMAGYTFARGTYLVDCLSVHNRNYGFYDEQDGDNALERCVDIGSGYGYKFCKNVRNVSLVDCVSVDAANWAFRAAFADDLRLEYFCQYNAPGRADVAPRVQSVLGWYQGEPQYERPVTNSRLEITASGSTLPVLNIGDAYNPNARGNTCALATSDETDAGPDRTPIPVGPPPPVTRRVPVPLPTPPVPPVHPVPGRIQAEDYLPGQGTGFWDTTAGNGGAAYRFDDVDIEYTPSIDGHNVGFIRPGEWLAYEVDVSRGGRYVAALRLACPHEGRSFQVEPDGRAAGRVTVPRTGGFEDYVTSELPLDLAPGRQPIVLRFDEARNTNLDWIEVRPAPP